MKNSLLIKIINAQKNHEEDLLGLVNDFVPLIKKYATKEKKNCNKTTAIYTGKKLKDCLMIPKDKAVKFVKVHGKWRK